MKTPVFRHLSREARGMSDCSSLFRGRTMVYVLFLVIVFTVGPVAFPEGIYQHDEINEMDLHAWLREQKAIEKDEK